VIALITACSVFNAQEDRPASPLAPALRLQEAADLLPGPVFDLGSWFGLTHPDDGRMGLGAPYLLSDSNGYSLREPLAILVTSGTEGPPLRPQVRYRIPGGLYERSERANASFDVRTVFSDASTAHMFFRFVNASTASMPVKIQWELPALGTVDDPNTFTVRSGHSVIHLVTDPTGFIHDHRAEWTAHVPAGGVIVGEIAIQLTFPGGPRVVPTPRPSGDVIARSEARWLGYLSALPTTSAAQQLLADKCIVTLVHNWRAAAGELRHDGLFPSYAYKGFNGFWAWDSWKHAAALVLFAPELAKDQVRAMFDHQDPHGMVADCVFRDTAIERHNWRNTKPPLAAWAVHRIASKTGDTAFVREMFPALVRYHAWWYADRDHNRNGLCEYGSTDGTRIAAAWESGMDNAVRFDAARIVRNSTRAWSLDHESVDLNAFLCAEKRYLAELAAMIGDQTAHAEFRAQTVHLRTLVQRTFYDDSLGYFFDRSFSNGAFVRVIGPEGWSPLWAGTATSEQAYAVVRMIMSPDHFNTPVPFPTLSATHPRFDPTDGYWRGPVWLDQAWMAIEGMVRYGYKQEARILKDRLEQRASGLLERGIPIHENYHPHSGLGLNAPHFSWSAASLLLLLELSER
jgi:putative isomerase